MDIKNMRCTGCGRRLTAYVACDDLVTVEPCKGCIKEAVAQRMRAEPGSKEDRK